MAGVITASAEAPCTKSRCVIVGSGFLYLPCEYHATRAPALIDSLAGHFETADGKNTIEWGEYDPGYFFRIQYFLLALQNADTSWRWPAIHNGRLWWHARVRLASELDYMITDGQFGLLVGPGSDVKPGELSRLLGTYERGKPPPTQCEVPEVRNLPKVLKR